MPFLISKSVTNSPRAELNRRDGDLVSAAPRADPVGHGLAEQREETLLGEAVPVGGIVLEIADEAVGRGEAEHVGRRRDRRSLAKLELVGPRQVHGPHSTGAASEL